jgi:hypothetical protein
LNCLVDLVLQILRQVGVVTNSIRDIHEFLWEVGSVKHHQTCNRKWTNLVQIPNPNLTPRRLLTQRALLELLADLSASLNMRIDTFQDFSEVLWQVVELRGLGERDIP